MARAKPVRIFYSDVTRRFTASTAYRVSRTGVITVTGRQYDVTQDIAALVVKHGIDFTAKPEERD